ncbi:MAG: TonB-dependent receptor [Actinobacteria bacterium]|nr:TonB-dependent receptor [Actinomycetota bacterium]
MNDNRHAIIFSFIAGLVIYPFVVFAQKIPTYESDEIVVTAGRIPVTFSDLTRSVTVIDREEIETAPVHNVQDLLQFAAGVDLRQRGPLGVQADVAIRGASFEQTLILVDGVKMSNPQTGHHNLNIPVTLDEIERIEILKGPDARLYGPNAFGGVINIITRQSDDKHGHIKLTAGDFNFSQTDFSVAQPIGRFNNTLSLSLARSMGYHRNTDFDNRTLFYQTTAELGGGVFQLSSGYMDKDFGAYKFYSERFPDERERINAGFMNSALSFDKENYSLSVKAYWQRHKDDFILDSARPDWYRNRHTTGSHGIELRSAFESRFGVSSLGGEIAGEGIKSSNLGNHSRTRGGLFFEQTLRVSKNLTLVPGFSFYYYSDWGWQIWPGLDVGLQLTETLRAFASVGRSFRVPTYTELFYSSPANMGNPDLKPEQAWQYETGLRWQQYFLVGEMALFRRHGRHLIDWVRYNTDEPWQALNIAQRMTNGAEISLTFYPQRMKNDAPVREIQLSYSYLDADKDAGPYTSKYSLDYLRQQFICKITHRWFHNVKQYWRLRYEERYGGQKNMLVDTRLYLDYKNLEFYVQASNLFDAKYVEMGFIPMPGRWIIAGLNFRWQAKVLD